ncbi:helix-turn-helix domain-containing protein [Luteithermobacter gelatinilyticus]|uniref:helix-turn-helix domain-containing protein n=1 Tax=Luteithermobacter gelatinilyticus TaxID=2582913 RepID=UPI001105E914|nr:XRE family transcriptional regulator [Luteithermobacter gelatinilyticus]
MTDTASKIPETTRPSDTSAESLGSRIRKKRKQAKLTLKKLSQMSDIPVSTLSKVENGLMSLNIQKLMKVSHALGLDVMQLVTPSEPTMPKGPVITGRRSITKTGQAHVVKTQQTIYEHHAWDFLNRKLVPTVITVQANLNPELLRHQGEEYIYVLEGTIEVLTEFYEPTRLEAGESIYIDSTMGHNVRAIGGKPARILNVMTSIPSHHP